MNISDIRSDLIEIKNNSELNMGSRDVATVITNNNNKRWRHTFPKFEHLASLYFELVLTGTSSNRSSPLPVHQNRTHLLFLHWFLANGGDLGRRCSLARASLQQVNPRGPRALVVLKVEEHVLVESEVLLGPAAVLRGLLAQEAALRALFTRNHRQIQSMALIVPYTFLHFMSPGVCLNFGYQLQTVTHITSLAAGFSTEAYQKVRG